MKKYLLLLVIFLFVITGILAELSPEENLWSEKKPEIARKIAAYQYTEALKALNSVLNIARSDDLKSELTGYLEDLKCEKSVFDNLTKQLSARGKRQKIIINNQTIWINKADENGFEGSIAGLSDSVYIKKWTDVTPRQIYDLFPQDMPKTEYLYLSFFCYSHNLLKEGEKILVSCLKRFPEQQAQISRFICRLRNITMPEGGFEVYEGQIVSHEDRLYMEKGYVKYEDRWMTYDEMMEAKGLVKFKDKWVKPEDAERLEFDERALEALKGILAPKGVIDKPGADSEKLVWDSARTRETNHYIVKANLSQDALDDVCYVMECFFLEASKIFRFYMDPKNKLKVYVFKNQDEYLKNGGPFGSGGVFMGSRIMTFYQPGRTTSVLLHEGTHQFVHLVTGSDVPLWINEGLAGYYETSKFEGVKLKTNIIHQRHLRTMQERIRDKTQSSFEEIINIKLGFTSYEYAHSWSLIYFFMNYKGGKYSQKFNDYFDELKKQGWYSNPDLKGAEYVERHRKLFEEAFGQSVDVIERQWEEYILGLK
ncbi:MAG: DUF1570 domain-containing protein [Planctomycetota bacterium]